MIAKSRKHSIHLLQGGYLLRQQLFQLFIWMRPEPAKRPDESGQNQVIGLTDMASDTVPESMHELLLNGLFEAGQHVQNPAQEPHGLRKWIAHWPIRDGEGIFPSASPHAHLLCCHEGLKSCQTNAIKSEE